MVQGGCSCLMFNQCACCSIRHSTMSIILCIKKKEISKNILSKYLHLIEIIMNIRFKSFLNLWKGEWLLKFHQTVVWNVKKQEIVFWRKLLAGSYYSWRRNKNFRCGGRLSNEKNSNGKVEKSFFTSVYFHLISSLSPSLSRHPARMTLAWSTHSHTRKVSVVILFELWKIKT